MFGGMDVYPQKLQQRAPDIHGMFPGIGKEQGDIGPGPAEIAAVADRQIGAIPDAVLSVRMKDEHRVILLVSSVSQLCIIRWLGRDGISFNVMVPRGSPFAWEMISLRVMILSLRDLSRSMCRSITSISFWNSSREESMLRFPI